MWKPLWEKKSSGSATQKKFRFPIFDFRFSISDLSIFDFENMISISQRGILNECVLLSGATAIVSKCLYEGEWVAVKSMTAMNIKVSEFV